MSIIWLAMAGWTPGMAQLVPKYQLSQFWDGDKIITFEYETGQTQVETLGSKRIKRIPFPSGFEKDLDFHEGRFWANRFDTPEQGPVRLSLHSSLDGVTWRIEASVPRFVKEGKVFRLLPLRDGEYLGIASKSFVHEGHTSKFALFASNGNGELGFRRLLDLGMKEPWFTPCKPGTEQFNQVPGYNFNENLGAMIFGVGAQWARSGSAIFLPDPATGFGWILETDKVSLNLRLVRLYDEINEPMLKQSWDWEYAILGVQPRQDGHFLVASRSSFAVLHARKQAEAHLAPITSPKGESEADQSIRKAAQIREVVEFGDLLWWDLDPVTGKFKAESSPPTAPPLLTTPASVLDFRFRFHPNEYITLYD